jgi:hypothetical protein
MASTICSAAIAETLRGLTLSNGMDLSSPSSSLTA